MQAIVVYMIVAAAALLAVGLFVYRWRHPEECAKAEGCTNCPLQQNCNKKDNVRSTIAK